MWAYAWTRFDGLPELFDIAATERHSLQKVHYLQIWPCLSRQDLLLHCVLHSVMLPACCAIPILNWGSEACLCA